MEATTYHLDDENNDAPIDVQHVVIDDSSMSILKAHALFSRRQLAKVEFLFVSSDGDDDGESRMTQIGNSAFRYCASLGSIYRMPCSLTQIGSWSFASCCQVMYIHLPDGIQSIGEGAFKFCVSLLTIRIPSSVRAILFSSFRGCKSLRSIELPPTLEIIGELVNIFFSKSLTVSGNSAFSHCPKLELLAQGEVSESAIIQGIQERFDGRPVHELCYYQSYHTSHRSLLNKLEDAIMEQYIRFETYRDAMGFGPWHILALAATPNVNFAKKLVSQVVKERMAFEKLKSQCFQSSLCRWFCRAASSSRSNNSSSFVDNHHMVPGLWPDNTAHDPLFYACLNMAPGSPSMIQFLYELASSHELEQLGLEQWRTDVRSFLVGELTSDNPNNHLDRRHNHDNDSDLEFRSRMEKVLKVNECFQRYLLKEKLALLELATWKASMMRVPKGDTKLLCQTQRQDYRTVCGIDVVISNTMTFLSVK